MASQTLRTFCLALAIATAASGCALAAPVQPVLVELFTSEGCSDCPPADDLLARLQATQFVPGARAIVLSEHVTYWNHEGWRDPFSSDVMNDRQNQYAQQFSLKDVYTPQMVVDGAEQFVGSDAAKLRSAVAQAAGMPKKEIAISDVQWVNGNLHFSVHGPAAAHTSLFGALAENATVSEVRKGENAGRTLHHVAVVREIKEFGSKAVDGKSLILSGSSSISAGDNHDPFSLVVFLVDYKTGHVVAVTEQTLNR